MAGGKKILWVEAGRGGGHPQTLVPWEHRDEDNQISEQGEEENGGGGDAPVPRWGAARDGPWAVGAPEGSRSRKETAHPPPSRAKAPRHPPVPRTPRLPLPSADHRKLGFQAKALVPDSAWAFSRHRVAGTSGVVQASPAKEAPSAAPLGLYHAGALPCLGRTSEPGLALGLIQLMPWAWPARELRVQCLRREGTPGLLSGSEISPGISDGFWAAEITQ